MKKLKYMYTAISTPYIQLYFIYKIMIMNFDTVGVKIGVLTNGKHTPLRRKGKNLLAQNSDNEWRDMPIHGLMSR